MTRLLRILVPTVAALALIAASCGPTDPPKPPSCTVTGVEVHRNLRYASTPGVDANLQSLDLYLPVRPAGCPAVPVVAYVHGGAFQVGDKANQLANKVNLFTGRGWALASLNYRLVGNPGSGPTNGVYPAAEQDVAAGIAHLAGRATQYRIDGERILLLGHSAGAFLVSAVATDGSFLAGAGSGLSALACVAPLDTTYDIPTQIAAGGMNELMYRNAFGNDPATWVRASPSRNVTAGKGIPSFHIVTRGAASRIAAAKSFGSTLRSAGIAADVQVAAGLTHEQVNDAVGRPGDTVITPSLMAFYSRCASR